jgi:hypothetical protein
VRGSSENIIPASRTFYPQLAKDVSALQAQARAELAAAQAAQGGAAATRAEWQQKEQELERRENVLRAKVTEAQQQHLASQAQFQMASQTPLELLLSNDETEGRVFTY